MEHSSFMSLVGQIEVIAVAAAVALFGINSLIKVFALDVLETIKVTKQKCFESGFCKTTTVEVTEERKGL